MLTVNRPGRVVDVLNITSLRDRLRVGSIVVRRAVPLDGPRGAESGRCARPVAIGAAGVRRAASPPRTVPLARISPTSAAATMARRSVAGCEVSSLMYHVESVTTTSDGGSLWEVRA